ncbi:MAG: peptidyl-prolyl cis-trans isomerase [Polyangiaceae bacterium]|nr:peptidyl-prolyl cis-trans isomerase [Polyangiaceae bacterium]
MHQGSRGLALAWLLGAGAVRPAGADSPLPRRDLVVARVGPGRAVTVGELEDTIARMPAFQQASFGASAAEVRARVLSDVVVRDALLVLSAEAAHVERRPETARALDWARSAATLRAIRAEVTGGAPVSADDVRAYYDANRARFESPERVRVFRILCETADDAARVLDAAKAELTLKTFGDLAREHSADKATAMRAGDLGFLTLDGTSREPGLIVDSAIVRAASQVRDGELVPAPVAEGARFAIVWRRGTVPATRRSLSAPGVADAIRETIVDDRVKRATDALVARLRQAKLRDYDPAPLDSLGDVAEPGRDGGR